MFFAKLYKINDTGARVGGKSWACGVHLVLFGRKQAKEQLRYTFCRLGTIPFCSLEAMPLSSLEEAELSITPD